MAKNLTQKQLEKHLGHFTKEELMAEVSKLFKRFPEVKEYYKMEYGGKEDREKILKEYKKKIDNQFFSTRGYMPKNPSAAALRKIISDFKKVAVFQTDVADLILHRVEKSVEFSDEFGGIDEPFYNALENAFKDAADIIQKEKLFDFYKDRLKEIVDSIWDTGWGLHDGMEYIYEQHFGGM